MATSLLVTIREPDGRTTESRVWSAPAEFDVAQARRFSRWQRALQRDGRRIVSIAPAS